MNSFQSKISSSNSLHKWDSGAAMNNTDIVRNYLVTKEGVSFGKSEGIRARIQLIVGNIFGGKPEGIHGIKKRKIYEIHDRFLLPEYLNTNSAFSDLEFLIFDTYRTLIFGMKYSDQEMQQDRIRLAKLALFLRKLSNSSGIVSVRSSGQTAFTHWMEAVYLYIQNDPRPTIDGIMRIGSHDTLEDPNFSMSSSVQWTQEKTFMKLEKLLGKDNLDKVRTYHTKPSIQSNMSGSMQGRGINSLVSRKEPFIDQSTWVVEDVEYRKKLSRNNRHLYKIRHHLSDVYFLEKMADVLSNVRNLDAFAVPETRYIDSVGKVRRKCMEIINYYLPRVMDLNDSYYCQIYSELVSLSEKYALRLPLTREMEDVFALAKKRIQRRGHFIIELESRVLSINTLEGTGRKSLSILRNLK